MEIIDYTKLSSEQQHIVIVIMTETAKSLEKDFAGVFFPDGFTQEAIKTMQLEAKVNGVEVSLFNLIRRILDSYDKDVTGKAYELIRGQVGEAQDLLEDVKRMMLDGLDKMEE